MLFRISVVRTNIIQVVRTHVRTKVLIANNVQQMLEDLLLGQLLLGQLLLEQLFLEQLF